MKLGDSLTQERKPLADKIRLLNRNSRNVAGRVRQALNQNAANRIECSGKDDRNGLPHKITIVGYCYVLLVCPPQIQPWS